MTNTPMTTATTFVTKAHNAALVALALGIAASALPAQAAILSKKSGDMNSYDCISRQELAYDFKRLGLRDVRVSKTDEHYVYRVTGYVKQPVEKAVESLDSSSDLLSSERLSKKDKGDYERVRYILIFDACSREIVEQIAPPEKTEMLREFSQAL